MKHLFVLLFFTGLSWGCKNASKNPQHSPSDKDTLYTNTVATDNAETDVTNNLIDPKELIAEIEYQLVARKEDADLFDNGLEPYITLEHPQQEINRLVKPNEMVLACDSATLIIDYPVRAPASFVIKQKNKNYTRKELVLEVSRIYHELYDEEEKTASVKTLPMKDRKSMNRNETNGKYGIWGHDLADLVLTSIKVYQKSNGQIYLTLEIES